MTESLETMKTTEEITERNNSFCVISKNANENGWRDLQTNSSWDFNPYGKDYAIVPDDMVPDILETCGFCDIELNEDGTEVTSFTAREIPEPEEPETPEDDSVSWDSMAAAIEEGVNEV